jgi:hypothetical protein
VPHAALAGVAARASVGHRARMMMPKNGYWAALIFAAACGGASSGAPAASRSAGAPAVAATPGPPPTPAPDAPAPAAAHTLRYVVVTAGRNVGSGETTIAADGSRRSHFTFNDRGRGPDLTTTLTLGADGAPTGLHVSGKNYWKVPVEETLDQENGELVWHSNEEHGAAPRGAGFYDPRNGPFDSSALLAHAIDVSAGKRVPILPAGEAWIDDDFRLDVQVDGKPRHLRRVALAGLGFSPSLVWLDENGDYFGEVSSWSSIIPLGAETTIPTLLAEDQKWSAARAGKLAEKLAIQPPAAGLAIVHARLFDAETHRVMNDQTVVVVGDRISAVGGAKTPVPAGATVVDAKGRLLMPGLWDMHVHLSDDDGLLDLAMGVTTVRDLGNDADALAARMARFDAGTEVGPRLLRGGLIDGKGELAAPTGVLVDSEDEARAAVKKFADMGYQQIKIYSSVKPALVPLIAKEAHARGLRVSGHVPQGMIAEQAVKAGFDEIQHANMLFLNFLLKPGDDVRGPARFLLVARGAAGLDLGSPQVKAFLALLIAHKTVLDPTLVAFEGMFDSNPGDYSPALLPYRGRLPAGSERGAVGGGLAAADEKERALFRASHAAMAKLVKLAWDKGIRIVAGTDGSAGLDLPRELELYVAAGIPAPEVLALATFGAAKVMGREKVSGSIRVGKQADLVLVDGDPTTTIGDVRKADLVVCRGKAYDPARLFDAVGMKPRQK